MHHFLNKFLFLTLISISSVAFASPQATTAIQSVAQLSPKCTIQGTRIDFGDISPKGLGYVSVVSYISTVCTRDTSYSIVVSAGTSGDILHRLLYGALSFNTDRLEYSVFKDLNLTSLLGDGTNGTSTLNGTGIGFTQTIPIYGYLKLNQYIRPDYYSDNLTVTINY